MKENINVTEYKLWERPDSPSAFFYKPSILKSKSAVVIFPGGGYNHLSESEGDGYARFFAENGMCSLVVKYSVYPKLHPTQLLEARRAVRLLRHIIKKQELNIPHILAIGSSAGGHLVTMLTGINDSFDYENCDDIDNLSAKIDAQILCYPVTLIKGEYANEHSGKCLLDDKFDSLGLKLSSADFITAQTPPTFIWQCMNDLSINLETTFYYTSMLKKNGVCTEFHLFPEGAHGIAIPDSDSKWEYCAQWTEYLINWLNYIHMM